MGPSRTSANFREPIAIQKLAYTPLIEEIAFRAVQGIRSTRCAADGTAGTYLLAGLSICGTCGLRMDSHWTNQLNDTDVANHIRSTGTAIICSAANQWVLSEPTGVPHRAEQPLVGDQLALVIAKNSTGRRRRHTGPDDTGDGHGVIE